MSLTALSAVAKNAEAIGRRRVQRRESMLLGQTMVGGELEAAPSHLFVVLEVRTAATPATLLDVVGKDAAQPERVVAEVRLHEKAAARVGIVEIAAELRDRVVDLVVGAAMRCARSRNPK